MHFFVMNEWKREKKICLVKKKSQSKKSISVIYLKYIIYITTKKRMESRKEKETKNLFLETFKFYIKKKNQKKMSSSKESKITIHPSETHCSSNQINLFSY